MQRKDLTPCCKVQRRDASCSGDIWLPDAKCIRKVCIMQREDFCNNHWLDFLLHHTAERFDSPLQNAAARFDSPLHNAAERFDSPLHHAAGSQTLILITSRIWKQIQRKLSIWIRAQGVYFWWKKRRWKISRYCPFKGFRNLLVRSQEFVKAARTIYGFPKATELTILCRLRHNISSSLRKSVNMGTSAFGSSLWLDWWLSVNSGGIITKNFPTSNLINIFSLQKLWSKNVTTIVRDGAKFKNKLIGDMVSF